MSSSTPTDVELTEVRAIVADYRSAESDSIGALGRSGKLVDAALMGHAANVLRREAASDHNEQPRQ